MYIEEVNASPLFATSGYWRKPLGFQDTLHCGTVNTRPGACLAALGVQSSGGRWRRAAILWRVRVKCSGLRSFTFVAGAVRSHFRTNHVLLPAGMVLPELVSLFVRFFKRIRDPYMLLPFSNLAHLSAGQPVNIGGLTLKVHGFSYWGRREVPFNLRPVTRNQSESKQRPMNFKAVDPWSTCHTLL